jgi:hypothetical protein
VAQPVDVWAACADAAPSSDLAGDLLRICESQSQVATRSLVDDLGEQALLETLLEHAKPPLDRRIRGMHYVLASPFRYPPLRHGSRFGSRLEPSLFYGALDERAVLAEAAYYRLVFFHGMAEPPPDGELKSQHTLFGIGYRTRRGLRLQAPPWAEHAAAIASPVDYAVSQRLGAAMRAAGVEAFEYPSARDQAGGINVALFVPSALVAAAPDFQQAWLCQTRADHVGFSGGRPVRFRAFPLDAFEVDGALPRPAA